MTDPEEGVTRDFAARPRTVRRPDAVVFEEADDTSIRVSLARLTSHREVLRVARYIAQRPGATAASVAEFITVACNAANLPIDP